MSTEKTSHDSPGEKGRAVFVDYGGTLVQDLDVPSGATRIELMPNAPIAINSLKQFGYRAILLINQYTPPDKCSQEMFLENRLEFESWLAPKSGVLRPNHSFNRSIDRAY